MLEKRPEINVERLVRHFNAPKNSFKEKLINKLTIGLVFMFLGLGILDRKSTRLNSSHTDSSRMPSSA